MRTHIGGTIPLCSVGVFPFFGVTETGAALLSVGRLGMVFFRNAVGVPLVAAFRGDVGEVALPRSDSADGVLPFLMKVFRGAG